MANEEVKCSLKVSEGGLQQEAVIAEWNLNSLLNKNKPG